MTLPATMFAGTFGWASDFLKLLELCFGKIFLEEKLRGWQWNVSTAFSGLGCAETVKS